MNYIPVNLADKFEKFSDHWAPRVIAEMNDYQFKLVKIQGEFVWHAHADTDEVFIVLEGAMTIELTVTPGEVLEVVSEESGFYWATQPTGERGWVPCGNVALEL